MAVCELRTTFDGPRSLVAGERVSCVVTIKAPDSHDGEEQADNTVLRAVAVQVVGIFNYNHQWCAPPSKDPQPRGKDALFDPVLVKLEFNERLLFATPLQLVGEHIVLAPGAEYRFSYSEQLPRDMPPSYKGELASYSARVVVGFYKVGADGKEEPLTTASRILRIRSPLAMSKCITCTADGEQFSATIRHGEEAALDDSSSAAAAERRAELFEPVRDVQRQYSQQICVNVMDGNAFVVRVVLPRTVLLPGQTLHGVCDFRGSDVLCQAFDLHVMAEESVDPAVAYSKNVTRVNSAVHSAQSCNCSCLSLVPFAVSFPDTCSPSFTTSLTSLRWLLVFCFHTVPDPAHAGLELATVKRVDFKFPLHVVVVE